MPLLLGCSALENQYSQENRSRAETKERSMTRLLTDKDVQVLIKQHLKKMQQENEEQRILEKQDRKDHIEKMIRKVNTLMSTMKKIHLPKQGLPGVPYDVVPILEWLREQVTINYRLLKMLELEIFKEKTGITVGEVMKSFERLESKVDVLSEDIQNCEKDLTKRYENAERT